MEGRLCLISKGILMIINYSYSWVYMCVCVCVGMLYFGMNK